MKHYSRMLELGSFSRSKLAEALNCPDATAATILQQYQKKGYIQRVRHDFYVVRSLESSQPLLSRYEIGSRLFPDACVSHHSAFEVFGCANQVFYDTYVTSAHRFKDFSFDGVTYRRVAPKGKPNTQMVGNIKVTTLEQTVIDSIQAVERIGGLEELVRCLMMVPSLRSEKLLSVLASYENGFLYQKAGYLLEQLNDALLLPTSFFNECATHISLANRYLTQARDGYVYHEKWRLYAPINLDKVVDKGVTYDVAI